MHRTRVVAAALTLALPLTTAQIVEAPVAQAQTVQTRTVTELDRDAFDEALQRWQESKAAAEIALSDAREAEAEAQRQVEAKKLDLREAQEDLAEAETKLEVAEAALDAVNVAAREQEARVAADQLGRAEKDLADKEAQYQGSLAALQSAEATRKELEERVTQIEREGEQYAAALKEATDALEELEAKKARIEERDRTGADYSVEDWERLTGQAVAEIINDYRRANGLHPLVVHDIYISQATAWSDQMVADVPRMKSPFEVPEGTPNAFRHSDRDAWGRSNENISIRQLGASPQRATRANWSQVPESIFTGWHNSPGHNKTMLGSQYQGIGVGIAVRPNGEVWATAMFFHDQVDQTSGYYYPRDRMTALALRSGRAFYLPSGARETMRTPALRDNLRDTKGVRPSYDGLRTAGLDFSRGKSQGLDPKIKRVSYDAQLKEVAEEQEIAEALVGLFILAVLGAAAQFEELNGELEAARSEEEEARDRFESAQGERSEASDLYRVAHLRSVEAEEALRRASDTPKQPLIDALQQAKTQLAEAERNLENTNKELSALEHRLSDLTPEIVRLQAALDAARADQPQEKDFTVERTITETIPAPPTPTATPTLSEPRTPPGRVSATAHATVNVQPTTTVDKQEPTPQDDGSSAGTVIGIVVAILAVVGIAVAALPQLGIQLPF